MSDVFKRVRKAKWKFSESDIDPHKIIRQRNEDDMLLEKYWYPPGLSGWQRIDALEKCRKKEEG